VAVRERWNPVLQNITFVVECVQTSFLNFHGLEDVVYGSKGSETTVCRFVWFKYVEKLFVSNVFLNAGLFNTFGMDFWWLFLVRDVEGVHLGCRLYEPSSTGYFRRRNVAQAHRQTAQRCDQISCRTGCLYHAQTDSSCRRFPRRRTYSKGIDHLFQIDLADMSNLSAYNDGYRYLLNWIDVFTKRAWSVPLKIKTGREVSDAFERYIPS